MPVNLTETSWELRRNMTDAKRLLWHRLKANRLDGLKFRRQEQIGRFIADFVCFEKGIVIEADGGQHATEREKDEERTQWLNLQGYTVLRFWNNDILTNTEGVGENKVCLHRGPLSPALSHRGARGAISSHLTGGLTSTNAPSWRISATR